MIDGRTQKQAGTRKSRCSNTPAGPESSQWYKLFFVLRFLAIISLSKLLTNGQTLAPFLTQVVGVDVSDNMVDEFNRNASAVGIASKMTGYKADLLSDSALAEFSRPEFNDFDVVAVSMALHHFENPDLALQRLAKRLKKGGVFYIIDFVPHSGHDHVHDHDEHAHGHKHEYGNAAHTVKTNGFSREDMQKLFQGAGLSVGYDYQVLSEQLVFNMEDKTFSRTAFMARAQLA